MSRSSSPGTDRSIGSGEGLDRKVLGQVLSFAMNLVARSLEADWNDKLRALAETVESYERERKLDSQVLSESRRQQLFSLVKDFPAVWNDPATPNRERKRMLGLLVEDVTLVKSAEITAHVRFAAEPQSR